MGKCLCCNQETDNPKYCSRSCANRANDKLFPRLKMNPQGKCKICSCPIRAYLVYCRECKENKKKLARKQKAAKNSAKVVQWRRNAKQKLVELRGGKCEICGYCKCLRALQFHHKNPAEKKFALSQANTKRFALMLAEVEKCILLCANCHAEIEDEKYKLGCDRNW